MCDCLDFLDTVRNLSRLQIGYIIFVGCVQGYPGMLKVFPNDTFPICQRKLE